MLGFLRFDEDYVDPVNCNNPGRHRISATSQIVHGGHDESKSDCVNNLPLFVWQWAFRTTRNWGVPALELQS